MWGGKNLGKTKNEKCKWQKRHSTDRPYKPTAFTYLPSFPGDGKNDSDVVFEIRKRLRIWAIKEPPRGGQPLDGKNADTVRPIKAPLRPFMIA